MFESSTLLMLPLATIAVGNGLFKANPSSLLSKVYEGTSYNWIAVLPYITWP